VKKNFSAKGIQMETFTLKRKVIEKAKNVTSTRS
jgi:hypothetical protein